MIHYFSILWVTILLVITIWQWDTYVYLGSYWQKTIPFLGTQFGPTISCITWISSCLHPWVDSAPAVPMRRPKRRFRGQLEMEDGPPKNNGTKVFFLSSIKSTWVQNSSNLVWAVPIASHLHVIQQ